MLKAKRSAEYVRQMASNAAKPQNRFYQRALAADKKADAEIYAKKRKIASKSLAETKRDSSIMKVQLKKNAGESNLAVTDVEDTSENEEKGQKTQRNSDLDGDVRSQTPNSQHTISDNVSPAKKTNKSKINSLEKAGERELVTSKARIKVENLVALIKK